ncbi:ATP-binding cassette sub-family A member 3 [Folsomia candida]|uniref:ATP-binding cassette sub-family A member 3 n=1 Tax=Folsomia candida TaxID=158441 RepID=A0A226EJ49_FOLCA|nr:ATP-binding cassette sub-family A member 3 [Folsomia candida]
MTRWERSHKSWNVNAISETKELQSSNTNSSWKKLKLLLWKNYTIQMRHKWQANNFGTPYSGHIHVIIKSEDSTKATFYEPIEVTKPPYQTLWRCDKLFYAPKNNVTDWIMNGVYQKYFYDEGFEYNLTGFDTEKELIDAYQRDSGSVEADDNFIDILLASSPVLAGVVFEGDFENGEIPKDLKYKLRFPAALRGSYDIIEEQTGLKAAWFVEILYPLAQLLGPRARNKTDGGLPGYREEGFLYLQNAVDQTFMQLVYNSSKEDLDRLKQVNVKIQRYPYIPYSFDLYLFAMQGFLPLLMLMSFIYPVINITKSIVLEKEKRLKLVFCFGTNIPISIGCQIISLFEGSGQGLQWSSLFEGSSPDDNFNMAYSLIMMVFNGFLHLFITFYIEAVWPGEYGIPLPYNFFLKKWYWTGGSKDGFDFDFDTPQSINNNGTNIEPSSRNLKAGIQIKNLTKIFGRKTAVNKLNLEIYEGQITALLGHNGAGKTTTISMLTGLFPPTSGTASIAGFDIHRDMDAIRRSLGICPQHNVLFDELTVSEHLEFFCLLKGMEKHLVDPEINRLLAAVGLESKRHEKSRTLSGGMKRKLSVLIALCAGSKICLLDEPTSGMDAGSRRNIWDLIQSEKKGRTIILSTHFMEEADVLGDRIAIMAEGAVECCGSSLFLKKRYGGGYNLIIVKNPNCVIDNITNLLKHSIPDAEIDQNVGAELSYILPDSQSHLFPAVFEDLEARREELGIARVLKQAESRHSPISKDLDIVKDTSGQHMEINHMDLALLDSSFLFKKEPLKRNSGVARLFQQMWSMILKKLLHVSRNKFLVLFQLVLPLLYLNITFFALQAFPGFRNPEALNVATLERYEVVGKTTTFVKCLSTNSSSGFCSDYVDYVSSRFAVENLGDENVNNKILKELSKNLVNVNYKYIVAFEEKFNTQNNLTDLIAYFNNQPYHGPPVSLNFVSNSLLKKSNHTITTYNQPFPFSTLDSVKESGSVLTLGFQVGYNIAIAISFLISAYVVFLVRERQSGCKHLQFVSGVKFWLYWGCHFVVDYFTYSLTVIGLLICLNIHQIEEFMDREVQIYFVVLMGLFGLAILPLTYLLSFVASNPTTAYSRLVILFSIMGLVPMIAMVFICMPGFYLDHLADGVNSYLLISPNYAMGQGIMQLSVNYHLRSFCGSLEFLEDICAASNDKFCCQQLKQNYLDWERMGVGKNVVYLIISATFYIVLLLSVEFKVFKKIRDIFRKPVSILDDNESDIQDPVGLEDSDVLNEEEKIRKTDLQTLFKSERLVVRDLTKTYKKFLAVDHLNFSVQPGECFGLLGVNGAGKTTTFKQLTGDIPPTAGDAFVCSNSIRTNLRQVHENIGYTPQFDGLIDELTARETIRMFARLKGVPEKHIKDLINELGQVLIFAEHLDKRTGDLSGGNKRKVSTACALVGKPEVVLLDEPSSGMDPVARRHLWNAISMIRDAGTSIVLTTHSLEEAEALVTRMGVMVNGRFRCIGSPQHLKNKFSKGYTLIAQTKMKILDEMNEPFTRSMEERGRRRSSVRTIRGSSFVQRSPLNVRYWELALDDLRTFIEDAFPDSVLKDIHPGFVHYHVTPSDNVSWGKMFTIMEEARVKFSLEAYSVGQTSLEQVFLNFSKAQINEQ